MGQVNSTGVHIVPWRVCSSLPRTRAAAHVATASEDDASARAAQRWQRGDAPER